ncbi:hypothetical protein AHF37_03704 [Paragonimus kellicotti]|nr:hypothetical protein AHF37_03704 [Paragonimus kellicotti]
MATENLAVEVFQQNPNIRSPPAENNDSEENRNAVERQGGSDQENAELIVLDPNHPLMRRVQDCLRTMLMKHLEQTEVLMREKDEELKREKATHVETGCELYNFQQDLAKFQVQLEKKHAEYTESLEKAEAAQTQLKELRENYRQVVKGLSDDTKTMHEMRDEVDALCLRLYYLNNAREEVLGDIKVMKRAAEKATIDLSKEQASCQATVDGLRKQIEKETLKKTELENKITTELRDRLTTKKAMEYVQKLNLQVQDQSREVITQASTSRRTIMLWEKKVQLCEETRHAVDCDLGQGELSVMKHEIHRMEVRKSSLLQQQEKLLQALERSVAKRDLIVLQAETQRTQKNKTQIRITVQRQLDELKKKLKATKQKGTSQYEYKGGTADENPIVLDDNPHMST